MNKFKTIASLGALPPGKRLIEYTHEYTKTYYNTYYQVVDEARADELESQLGTNGFCNFDDEVNDQAQWLGEQQEPSYDSEETDEEFNGVELLQATVKYDPSDQDQRHAVEQGWQEHYKQQKIDDLDIESPHVIDHAVKCIKECDQLDRDYEAVKQTQGAQG